MKLYQNPRHWATRKALTTPGISRLAHAGLVRLHTNIFVKKADEDHREERREHLDALFDATVDTYTAALEADYSEAHAREITHVQANFDFYNHGWVEMMEIPVDELDAHYERYEDFFERHDITIDDPLGAFRPTDGIPDAPATPEKLDAPEQPDAVGGYADDVYVEDASGEVRAGDTDEPTDVSVTDSVGVTGESVADENGTN